MLLNDDGTFFEKRKPVLRSDYGSAIGLTFTVEPKATQKIAIAVALDFPEQVYIDGTKFERKYVKNFKDAESRAVDLARLALDSYPQWRDQTVAIQKRIFDSIQSSASYKDDRAGALRLTRLILNELHFPLSNAIVWVEDEKNGERARFLECFDYAYIDPSDVDWYSMVLLMLFPRVEKDLCQGFIDSIQAEDPTPRFYHEHASNVAARKHFKEHPEEYEGVSMTQIRDAFKTKGSVAHDLGAMPKGHPLRNVSDYAWYNNNYWVDLFPKLMMRVLRNVKFTGDIEFLKKNWETLKFGLESLLKLDFDDDGIPEGYPEEVKNTFDNLVLFGADAYDATQFLGGCQAMIKMAQMLKDKAGEAHIKKVFDQGWNSFEQLWREGKNKQGEKLEYYITCFDPATGNKNTDVWTNQLDALWYLISIGEEPFHSRRSREENSQDDLPEQPLVHGLGHVQNRGRQTGGIRPGQGRLYHLQLRLRPVARLLRHVQGEQGRLRAHGPGRFRLRQLHDYGRQSPGGIGEGNGRIQARPALHRRRLSAARRHLDPSGHESYQGPAGENQIQDRRVERFNAVFPGLVKRSGKQQIRT